MLFGELAAYLERLEKTSSRIEITKILARLFGEASANEIDKVVYLSLGGLAPVYAGMILNIAEKMMMRVISTAYDRTPEAVKAIYKKTGDLGETVNSLSLGLRPAKKLTVTEVHEELLKVAQSMGAGSQERKIKILAGLLQNLDPLSAKFVARIPVGRLRLGFSDKTVLDALSWLEKGDKSAKADLEKAYAVLPDPGLLAKRMKEVGLAKTTREVKPQVGVPVLPMLAQRLKSTSEMIAKMGKVGVEPKLDGLRLLIHFKSGRGGLVKAFTRNLNECTWMFPELIKIGGSVRAKEAILDCEAVGLDEATQQMANFQTTMTRRRKHGIAATSQKVGIEFYFFDLLAKDGQNLMNQPYIVRRQALEAALKPDQTFKLVDHMLTEDPKQISELYQKNVKQGYEGIIVKKADGKYVPGRTGWRWVKMKQVEAASGKLADTIDAVVMGYTLGKGKRAGFGVGQFLVGIKDGEKIKTTSKIGTGLTDEQFKELAKKLQKSKTPKMPREYAVHKNYTPDFWVEPFLVVEIAADEITQSPTHTAGLALRFPRLIRFRDDKSPAQITTLTELQQLYKLQKG